MDRHALDSGEPRDVPFDAFSRQDTEKTRTEIRVNARLPLCGGHFVCKGRYALGTPTYTLSFEFNYSTKNCLLELLAVWDVHSVSKVESNKDNKKKKKNKHERKIRGFGSRPGSEALSHGRARARRNKLPNSCALVFAEPFVFAPFVSPVPAHDSVHFFSTDFFR